MLRLTKQTDYGIMLMAHLAGLPAGAVLSARQAADRSGLSLPMVSKILKALAKGQLLESHRGVGGGYRLAFPAEETSVARVIRALEGPISMVECGSQPGHCSHEHSCPARVNWTRINCEIERTLDRIPVSEMIGPLPCSLLSVDQAAATPPTS